MRFRAVLVALAILGALPAANAAPAVIAPAATAPASSSSAVMESMGLDRLFVRFGQNIALSPRRHGISNERFLAAWERATAEAFTATALNVRLSDALARELTPAELARIGAFLRSPFGSRVTRLEQAAQGLTPQRQIAAIARGQTLYLAASPVRRALFEELLELSGAELTFAMLGESLRGLALGMHLVSDGDIDIPWAEIDAAVASELSGLRQSLAEASRGALALTYRELSDAELAEYVAFLRTPASRKFYAVTAVAVGSIIGETMFALGEDVALRLQRVNI